MADSLHFELDGREFVTAIEEPMDGVRALPPILAVQDLAGGAAFRYPLDSPEALRLRRRVSDVDSLVGSFAPSNPQAVTVVHNGPAEIDYDKLAAAMAPHAQAATPEIDYGQLAAAIASHQQGGQV